MRTLLRLLKFLRPLIAELALSVLLGLATVAAGIGLLAVSADLISRAALRPSIAELQVAMVGVRFFGLSRAVFRYLERLVSHSLNFRLLAELRVWFFSTLEPLAPARLQDYRSGDLLTRSLTDIETLDSFYVRSVSPPLVAVLITAGMAVWFGRMDLLLAVPLLVGLLTGGMLIPLAGRLLAARAGQSLVATRADFSQALVSSLQGQVELAVYGQTPAALRKLSGLNRAMTGPQLRLQVIHAWISAGTLLASLLTMLAVFWRAIVLVQAGILPGTLLAVIVVATMAAFEAVSPLTTAAVQLESCIQAGRRLFAVADQRPGVPEPVERVPTPSGIGIQVQNLSFRYPGRPVTTLRNLTLDLPAGKKVAIVGPNGAGKSTLLALLMRFWPADGGRITIGGREITCLTGEQVLAFFTVIPQRAHLFAGTLRSNLLLADPHAGDDQIVGVLQEVGLGEWLQKLPAGLDTWVGERGGQVSAGQRQRLAVARALLKDAPVALLDEPTAHLDAFGESQLTGFLHAALNGRSQIWVSHRLIQMECFDEILVMSGGQVVERGSHVALLNQTGLYSRLFAAQQHLFE